MAQYYVDKAAGNDSNTGLTAALAKKTIQPTLSLLQAGDTLNILAGDYNETLSSTTGLNAGSSFGSPITVKAYNGAAVTVRNVVWYHTNAEYWIFQDLKIDGQYTETVCAYVAGLSHVKFIGCEITHSKQFGSFNTRTDDVYFTECNIHHNGQTPGNDHGMFVAGTTTFIDGCTVHDNMGYGIHLYEANAGTAGFSTDLSQVTRNKVYSNGKSATVYSAGILLSAGNTLLCANNILWNNKNAGIEVGYSLVTNAKVYNNTLYNNGGYGIDIRSDATTVLITNNIVYSNSGGTINDEGASGVVLTTNLTTDPTFVSVSGLDFHIQTTSAAKDAGTTLGDVTVDYDGGTRPFNAIYDIGAFEFGATPADVPAPPVDTSGTFTGPGAVINPDGSITSAANTVPFGGFFFNTLDEFSLPTVLAVQKATDTLPNTDSMFNEDWINVVRDFGVLGDGSDETAKIQEALDFAASGGTKTKVLIPGGITVVVSPQELDNDINGVVWGPLPICLWLDSGVTVRIDGVLKVLASSVSVSGYPNNYAVVFENRNAFVGDLTNRDQDITIEGNGTIDLEGLFLNGTTTFTSDTTSTSPDKQQRFIWAGRFYKCDRLTIKDLKVKHGVGDKWHFGFSEFVEVRNVKFVDALRYEDSSGIFDTRLITLDVCNKVSVLNCIADNCKIHVGIYSWASKNVLVIGNNFSDFYTPAVTGFSGVKGRAFIFLDYGEEFVDLDMDLVDDIYDFAEGFDARTIIANNIFCRNGIGLEPLGGAWDAVPTRGFQIINNSICSNLDYGIYFDGLENFIFYGNQIENNGWGTPIQFD